MAKYKYIIYIIVIIRWDKQNFFRHGPEKRLSKESYAHFSKKTKNPINLADKTVNKHILFNLKTSTSDTVLLQKEIQRGGKKQ